MADEKIIVTEDDEENYVCAVNEIVQVREFNAREIKQGKHLEFINELMKLNEDPESLTCNDIHIEQFRNEKTHEIEIIVEWVVNSIDDFDKLKENNLEDDYNGSFLFCGIDETIAKVVIFPDGTDLVVDLELVEFVWQTWMKNHPEWKLNEDGTWTNVLEYDKTEIIDKDKIVN